MTFAHHCDLPIPLYEECSIGAHPARATRHRASQRTIAQPVARCEGSALLLGQLLGGGSEPRERRHEPVEHIDPPHPR